MSSQRFLRPILAASVALAMAGCASTEEIDEHESVDRAPYVRTIVLCHTALADIRTELGEPSRDGLLHGKRVLSWVTAWEPLVKYLAVLVDENGVVVDLYWDIPSEIPWTPADQCQGD